MMRESEVERYLMQEVKKRSGEVRKAKWIGRRGAPDRRILGKCWVEVKATGVTPEDYQLREHARMKEHGERVEVVDSFEAVDTLIKDLYGEPNFLEPTLPSNGLLSRRRNNVLNEY
jgi:hypothetical protein